LRLRLSWRPPLLISQTTTPGGAPFLACLVLATPMRAIILEVFSGLANLEMSRLSAPDCIDFDIDPLRLPRCVVVFVLGGSSSARGFLCGSLSSATSIPFTPPPSWRLPRAPAASCAAPYPRQPRRLHVDHDYPTHGIIDHNYSPSSLVASTSAQRATIRMSYSSVFSPVAASAQHRRSNCGGMSVHRLIAFGFFSSVTICGAPTGTAGEC
jgi:hypothetical protein